jgi:integrase
MDETQMTIASWTPKDCVESVASFVRDTVVGCNPASPSRARALIHALFKLASFAEAHGLPLETQSVLHPSVIERFLAAEQKTMAHGTIRTIATNLRAIRRCLAPQSGPEPLGLGRERAKAPYLAVEIDRYMALAAAQPTVARAMRATALISLGAGAGLRGADLRHVRGSDIQRHGKGLLVTVGGVHPRRVPVLLRFQSPLWHAAQFAGTSFIVGGVDRARKNITSSLVASLAGGIDIAPVEIARLRSTWLSWTAEAIGLRPFMDAAGLRCSQRLGDLVSGLGPVPMEKAMEILGAIS